MPGTQAHTAAHSHERQRMQDLLEEIGWKPERSESGEGFFVDISDLDPVLSFAYIGLNDLDDTLNCTICFAISAPADRRTECASLFMAMNWNLATGNFQLDLEDGQLRHKSGINLSSATFQESFFKNLVVDALVAVDKYKDIVCRFINGELTLKEAIVSLKKLIAESEHDNDNRHMT
jgi:hypothetical protein